MTQDFAKDRKTSSRRKSGGSRNTSSKKTSTKSGAGKAAAKPNRRQNTRQTEVPSRSLPGWLWMVAGLAIGLFIGGLYHIATVDPTESADSATAQTQGESGKQEQTTQSKKQANQPEKTETKKPEFKFYSLLPESEVEVQVYPITSKPKEKVDLYLQAGSFRNWNDAEKMRVELIMLNMDVAIETSKNKQGTTWHRVIAGPFPNRSKMAKARSTMANMNINPLLLKRKPKKTG